MKSSIWSKVFTLGILCMSLSAHAKPQIDNEVSQFLNETNKGNEFLPVIISFKGKSHFNLYPKHSAFHTLIQRQMMEETQKNIESFMAQSKSKAEVFNLWVANSAIVSLDKSQLKSLLESDELTSISFSKKMIKMNPEILKKAQAATPKYTYGLTNIQIPNLLAKYPHLTGKGMKIGILDTGIVPTHPDLKGKMIAYKNFSPATSNTPSDGFGHGTHVSGTIVGGSTSGLAIGVAPDAQLIVGRIFDGNGNSTKEDILKAMQWMADPDGNPNTVDSPAVVNNSWGDDEAYRDRDPENDPMCLVIDSWVKLGIVPVFTAGNTGPRDETINVPGACPNSVTVGATEQYDRSPHFSSSGPTSWKTVRIVKPDVSAPGVDVKSADRYGSYENMSGTSMAAPHVSGAIALILQSKPELTVDELKDVLYRGSKDLGKAGKDNTFGFGRLDVLKSVELAKELK